MKKFETEPAVLNEKFLLILRLNNVTCSTRSEPAPLSAVEPAVIRSVL